MSERNLVVHQAQLSAIESALAATTQAITEQIHDLLTRVEDLTPSWEPRSQSHAAHLDHQQRLRDGVAELTGALDRVKDQLATYREDAREIEIANVAIVS